MKHNISNHKIKVCFISGGLSDGGIGRALSNLVNALCVSEHIEVYIFSYRKSAKEDIYKLPSRVKREYLTDNYMSMKKFLLRGGTSDLRNLLKRHNINVAVACGVLFFPLVTVASILANVRSICWEHTSPETATDLKGQHLFRYIGAYLSTANIVISKGALEYYRKKYKNKNNILIYNGLDSMLKSKLKSYNPNTKKIISVGRLTDAKDYHRLIRIAKIVLNAHQDWKWDIYGEGELRKSLEAAITENGLEDRVVLKGHIDNIYDVYQNYSIFVMTSKYEGFPMVLLEAAYMGLPLIAFDIKTGPSEIIDNKNGFLCNKDQDTDMIDAIIKTIKSSELRLQQSKNSRIAVMKYDISRIADQWIEVINSITM